MGVEQIRPISAARLERIGAVRIYQFIAGQMQARDVVDPEQVAEPPHPDRREELNQRAERQRLTVHRGVGEVAALYHHLRAVGDAGPGLRDMLRPRHPGGWVLLQKLI
ncbi:MAG TPA: hypothetical protein VGV14_08835, partial [Rhodanobacter sp.]|nr:hypothetical protein [Rhodanobacter sp.]